MTVHIVHEGSYSVVRCPRGDEGLLRTALVAHGYSCGNTRDVEGIKSMIEINIRREGSWGSISADDINNVVKEAGLSVAE